MGHRGHDFVMVGADCTNKTCGHHGTYGVMKAGTNQYERIMHSHPRCKCCGCDMRVHAEHHGAVPG